MVRKLLAANNLAAATWSEPIGQFQATSLQHRINRTAAGLVENSRQSGRGSPVVEIGILEDGNRPGTQRTGKMHRTAIARYKKITARHHSGKISQRWLGDQRDFRIQSVAEKTGQILLFRAEERDHVDPLAVKSCRESGEIFDRPSFSPCLPAADENFFRDMDGGIELTASEIKGRLNEMGLSLRLAT